MRTSQRAKVFYYASDKPVYDPELGKMIGGVGQVETLPCFYSDMGIQLKNTLLDKTNVDAKIIRFNKAITKPIEKIMIGNKTYKVINKKSFYERRSAISISEVMR